MIEIKKKKKKKIYKLLIFYHFLYLQLVNSIAKTYVGTNAYMAVRELFFFLLLLSRLTAHVAT